MKSLPFIFSNQTSWKITRHSVFWLLWFLFQLLLYSFTPSPLLQKQNFLMRVIITVPDNLIYLIPDMFLAYTLMYWVVPEFILPGKYFKATVFTIVLFVITAGFCALLSITVIDAFRQYILHNYRPELDVQPKIPFYVQIGLAILAGLRGGITIGGLAAAIKLMQCFYEKQQAALVLEREKVSAELQMLKAQLHPHFLFNTLNNIYAHTQQVSVVASKMIFGLSDLLRYMLYDCNQPLVSLEKELKMINDYIALEKARYDHQLDLAINLPQEYSNLQIAPLLLLPLIENAFKHGASKMISHPWISLHIDLNGDIMFVKLINGKETGIKEASSGIGLANLHKRLELLYQGNYKFEFMEEEEMYIVNLKLRLSSKSLLSPTNLHDDTPKKNQVFNN